MKLDRCVPHGVSLSSLCRVRGFWLGFRARVKVRVRVVVNGSTADGSDNDALGACIAHV